MDRELKNLRFLWTDSGHIMGMMTIKDWEEYSKGIEFQKTTDCELYRNAEWVKGIQCKYNKAYYEDAKKIAELLYLEDILVPKTVFPMAFTDEDAKIVILIAPAIDDDEPFKEA